MGNAARGFFIALFDVLLIYVIIINFNGWSGAFQPIGVSHGNGWTNGGYFGFQSIIAMFQNLNKLDGYTRMFTLNLSNLSNWIMLNLPSMGNDMAQTFTYISKWFADGVDIKDIVGLLANLLVLFIDFVFMFASPLMVLYYSLLCLAPVLMFICDIVATFILALSGYFNVTADMYTFSDYLSELSSFASSSALILFTN